MDLTGIILTCILVPFAVIMICIVYGVKVREGHRQEEERRYEQSLENESAMWHLQNRERREQGKMPLYDW